MASITPNKSILINVASLVCIIIVAVAADKADLSALFGEKAAVTLSSVLGIINVVLHSLSSSDKGPAAS